MRCLPLLLLFLPLPALGQTVTPNFTQGSMTSTTTTTQTISETIQVKIYGGDYANYSGVNVTPSGAIGAIGTTYSVTNAGGAVPTRNSHQSSGHRPADGHHKVNHHNSTTNSLSVFSQ